MSNIVIPFDWPTEWADWIALCEQWYQTTHLPIAIESLGINNIEALKTWLLSQGYAIATGADGTIEILKVELLDAANSSMSLPVPIEQFAESAGTAGTIASYAASKGTYAGIKRATLVGIVASLLMTQIAGAQEVGQSVQEDLKSVVDKYLIPGTDLVRCYFENNIPYIREDIIQDVRDKMVELGVYQTGGFTPSPGSDTALLNISFADPAMAFSYYFDLFQSTTGRGANAGMYTGLTQLRNYAMQQAGGYGKAFSIRYYSSPNQVYIDYFPNVQDGVFNTYVEHQPYGTFNGFYLDMTNAIEIYLSSSGSDYSLTLGSQSNIRNYAKIFHPGTADVREYLPGFTNAGSVTQAVPGMTPTSTDPADPTKSIADLLPLAWDNKKTLAFPVEGNLFNTKNFLPVNIEVEDPFEDGTTQSSTDAQTGTTPTNEDVQQDILDAVPDITNNYMNDTGVTGGDVGDTGDTPPAIPPVISASANGLWAIYNPTIEQVQRFGSYLWDSNIIDQITRMFASPIEAVIGFHMIYCTPIRGTDSTIKCGYLDSGVPSRTVANQYVEINCGTVEIGEYYRTAIDYDDTKISIYLPFIGIEPLDASVVMGSSLEVIYRIDVLTGTCLAQIKVIKESSDAVMYQFVGNCSVQVPLTASTYTGTVGALMGMATAIVGGELGSPSMMMAGAKQVLGAAGGKAGTAKSGTIGANAGAMGIRIPYVIITHPVSYDAFEYNTQYGYPLNQTVGLNVLSGYTKVKDIHLHGIPCTDDELEMIERLLKDGVIIN